MTGSAYDPRSSVKLADVAEAAGVAPMTVSRVIHTPDRVSAATAARVRAAMQKLGFVPQAGGNPVPGRRSRVVAAIVPEMAQPLLADTMHHFTETMRGGGYHVILSMSAPSDFSLLDVVRTLLTRQPDGMLIAAGTQNPPLRRLLAGVNMPVVEAWDLPPQPLDMIVAFDHARAGAAVAAFFHAKGLRRFAVVSGPGARARARSQGFIDAVRQCGGTLLSEPIVTSNATVTGGRQAMAALVSLLTSRAGLFCTSDPLAFGAITEARARGINVPAQVAVCGFGDLELGAASEPPFTTVSVDGPEIGRTAAGLLLRRLAGEPASASDRVYLSSRIVERAST